MSYSEALREGADQKAELELMLSFLTPEELKAFYRKRDELMQAVEEADSWEPLLDELRSRIGGVK